MSRWYIGDVCIYTQSTAISLKMSQLHNLDCRVMLVITEALCNGNYTALISASGRIHCTLVVCNSERVTVILHSTFLKFHWSSVVSVLSGCYMAGAKWNCCHLGTCFEYTTPHTSLHCHLIWSHIRRMHVCLAVTATYAFGIMTGIFYMLLQ